MIWQAPWAFLGLAALAIPIAVHLLTRRQARRVAFPTLRFLVKSESSAIRRHRLTDRALFFVRAGIVAAAVVALAQPYVTLPSRVRGQASGLSRAVVIDSSVSMLRGAGGVTALTAARTLTQQVQPVASATSTIESPNLRVALGSATAWLARAPGRHELVIVSDFQRGALDEPDLETIPASTGLRLLKIEIAAGTVVTGPSTRLGGRRFAPQIEPAADWLDVRWVVTPEAGSAPAGLKILSGPSEQAASAAALEAASTIGFPADGPDRRVVIVLPAAAERAALVSQSGPIDRPWMFDAVSRLTELDGVARVSTASGTIDGHATLLIFPASSAPVPLAMIVATVLEEITEVAPLSELEPLSIPDATLQRWERAPSPTAPTSPPPGESDGRWVWVFTLAMLTAETWIRRRPRTTATLEIPNERVA